MTLGRGALSFHIRGRIATIDRRGVIHAAPEGAQFDLSSMSKRRHGRPGLRMLPTECGMKQTRPMGVRVVTTDGEPRGVMTLLWPPRLATLEPGWSRCQQCYIATGKPRPAYGWGETFDVVGVAIHAGGAV